MPATAMQNPPTKEAHEATSHRRAWYRLHLSTWIALLLLVVLLTIIVIPGEIQHSSQGNYGLTLWLQHGWPWPYLERSMSFPYPAKASDLPPLPRWTNAWAWSGHGVVDRFALHNLALDILSAGVLLVLFAIIFEWGRRKRKRRLSQWTLRELLVAVTLLACLFAWWQVDNARRAGEEMVLEELRTLAAKSGGSIGHSFPKSIGPVWLRRLVSCGKWAFHAQHGIAYQKNGSPVTAADIEPLVPSLARLKYLDTFNISTTSDVDESALRTVARIPGIECLELYCGSNSIRISSDEMRTISGMTDLKALEFNGCLEIRGSHWLESLKDLERLTICQTKKLDDPQLGFLAGMKNLRRLALTVVPCDDRAVDNLCRLQNLERIEITWTEISQEGIDRLRAALPDCDTSVCFVAPKKPAGGNGGPSAAEEETEKGKTTPINKE